ncbi:MAG: hypothetical protein AAF649_10230 [Verrucomicrobiota bacterium]
MPVPDHVQIIEAVIRRRMTEKVMCELTARNPVPAAVEAVYQPLVRTALTAAGWAPFHYPRSIDGMAEPWRAHILWNRQAGQLARYLSETLQVTTKEPQLAAACSALVLVTWLPESPPSPATDTRPSERNEEHLAATSAMV